jgi:hypothetical protein
VEVLVAVGVRDGKPETLLLQALKDKAPARRAAAAVALCRGGAREHLPAVLELLKDSNAEVRLRTAYALVAIQEKQALGTLVALLGDVALEQAWEVEDFLVRVAGERAPQVSLTPDPASRPKAVQAWTAWHAEHGRNADLTLVSHEPRSRGYWLLVESYDAVRRGGRVLEQDAAGKVRWQIEGLQYPQYAEVLPGDRVLIAEQGTNRVTERDFTGKILWERPMQSAFRAQRLRNGHTFIAGRQLLIEIDRDGREVFRHQRTNDTILAARKHRDGHVAFVTYQGVYVRLDPAGKEVKTFRVPINPNFGASGGDVCPGDRLLIATPNINKVAEYDADGKVVWEATVPWPGAPYRLPNGHTLVVSHSNSRVTELDRSGKVVSERKDLGARPWLAIRR